MTHAVDALGGRLLVELRSMHSCPDCEVHPQDARGYPIERYFQTSTLMGTPQHCMAMVEQLPGIGVDEIACLVDFGVAREDVMGSLGLLDTLT